YLDGSVEKPEGFLEPALAPQGIAETQQMLRLRILLDGTAEPLDGLIDLLHARHRRACGPLTDACAELGSHAGDDASIVAGLILPEQPCGRVPGAVVAIEHPAPVRRIGKRDPGRAGQRASEMRHAGVDGDHKVKA